MSEKETVRMFGLKQRDGSWREPASIKRNIVIKDGLPIWDPPGGEQFSHSHIPDGPDFPIDRAGALEEVEDDVVEVLAEVYPHEGQGDDSHGDLPDHSQHSHEEHADDLKAAFVGKMSEIRRRRRMEGKLAPKAEAKQDIAALVLPWPTAEN